MRRFDTAIHYALALVLALCAAAILTGCLNTTPENKPSDTPVDSLVTIQELTGTGLARIVDRRYGVVCYTKWVYGGRAIACIPLTTPQR